jgi:hypothetical protein
MLETERKSVFLKGDWSKATEGDRTFGHANVTPAGATVVFHDVQYADRGKYAPVGVMIRTNAVTRLAASATESASPWVEMTVPNTEGQWRYIVPDTAWAATPGKRQGDNIIYFKFTGEEGATADASAFRHAGDSGDGAGCAGRAVPGHLHRNRRAGGRQRRVQGHQHPARGHAGYIDRRLQLDAGRRAKRHP